MTDANKRINLAVPLLSVRRHGRAGAEATGLPSCDTDGMHDGVPFGWEHRPGQPKSVRTRRIPPLPTVSHEQAVVAAVLPVREDTERFSNALSVVDGCFTVNCGVTGRHSDAGAPAGAAPRAGGSVAVMMDRFLLAFRKAVGYPQCTSRRDAGAAAATGSSAEAPTRTGDWDVHSARGFTSKRCGLLPTWCVKRILLLLSPGQAIRRSCGGGGGGAPRWRGRRWRGDEATTPLVPRSRDERHLGHDTSCMPSWEEVYINRLLRSERGGFKGRAELTSELDRTVREFYTDEGEGVHHKASRHLGLLLVLDRTDECHDDDCPSYSSAAKANAVKKFRRDGGGYDSPLLLEDKTAARRDIVPLPPRPLLPLPPPRSPSQSWLSRALPSVSNKPPNLLLVLDRIDECRDNYPCTSAQDFPEAGEPALLLPPKSSRPAKANDRKKFRRDAGGYDSPLFLEDKTAASPDIVPLPPPRSPSESWLSRALPSVSNKTSATSFLGIHVQHKKQAPPPWCSSDQTKVIDHARPRQINTST